MTGSTVGPACLCSSAAAVEKSSILKQEGRTETIEGLEWADRCDLLHHNPVTAARMFDLREVLMSPSHPASKIKDYFYRVEFQQRISPHVH